MPHGNTKPADRVCEEALLQMGQGTLVQPRKLLESALRMEPTHLPTRIALVELAIRESKPVQAVREAKRATSIALLRCREAGLARGRYADTPAGILLLKALKAGAHAHLATGETTEAINALAVVLQEDPLDPLDVCPDLIDIFMDQGRPEGVVGLYRLEFIKGPNLADVILTAALIADPELFVRAFLDLLESAPTTPNAICGLQRSSDTKVHRYVLRRQKRWNDVPLAKVMLRQLVEHPVIAKTVELLEEVEETATFEPDLSANHMRDQLIGNLREPNVLQRLVTYVKDAA